jgi:DNA repair protein RadC
MPLQNVLPIDRAPENRFSGLGPDDLNEGEIDSLLDLALSVLAQRHRRGEPLTSPETSRAYLRLRMGERKFEVFARIYVDNRHRIIAFEELFQGTIDGASVHPRVVVQRALELNAAAVLFAHYVPRNIMGVMCPKSLCGVIVYRADFISGFIH